MDRDDTTASALVKARNMRGRQRRPGAGQARALCLLMLGLCAGPQFGCQESDDIPPAGLDAALDGATPEADGGMGGEDGGEPGEDGGEPGEDGGGSGLSFSPCPLLTEPGSSPPGAPPEIPESIGRRPSPARQWAADTNQLEELGSAMAECATVRLPLEWSDPDGAPIDVFVKRLAAKRQPATGQLWMLEGGPGFPGSSMEAFAFLIADGLSTLDIYLPDHRGTGKSRRLPCETGKTNIDCALSTPDLGAFTISNAARDLAALIDESHRDGQSVFVYGVSYGTAWAQRYLQIRPDQARAVILDSVMPPEYDWAESDKNDDAMARHVLALCDEDAFCAGKLGMPGLAAAAQAIQQTRSGTCRLPPDVPSLSRYLGALVASRDTLPLLPASIYRVLRCAPADVEWLAKVWSFLRWANSLFSSGRSNVLLLNIVLSEFWHPEASLDELRQQEEGLLAHEGSAALGLPAALWPRYTRDAYHRGWPKPAMPILILQGGVDPLTPYGDLVHAHYPDAMHYYVELPNAGHAVMVPRRSPMKDPLQPGCGFVIAQSFLAHPERSPDTSCVADMAPVDFAARPASLLTAIGVEDAWEYDIPRSRE